jgi:hypothetical protein
MPFNLQNAEKSIRLLATAFFHHDLKTLEKYFGINGLQMNEAIEILRDFLEKDDCTSLSAPPQGSKIILEDDDICAEDEHASIRIYPLNSGGWGYEMDVFIGGQKSDLTMRGELSEDFCENPRGIKFHLFEVM